MQSLCFDVQSFFDLLVFFDCRIEHVIVLVFNRYVLVKICVFR